MGWVNFSALGLGFGFSNFVRVGSQVFWYFFGSKEKFLGSPSGQINMGSGQTRVKKFYIFDSKNIIGSKKQSKMTKNWTKMQKIGKNFNIRVARVRQNLHGLWKYYYGLARVLGKIVRVGLAKTPSGRAKFRVGFWPDPSLKIRHAFSAQAKCLETKSLFM